MPVKKADATITVDPVEVSSLDSIAGVSSVGSAPASQESGSSALENDGTGGSNVGIGVAPVVGSPVGQAPHVTGHASVASLPSTPTQEQRLPVFLAT